MAKRIRVDQIDDYSFERFEEMLKDAVNETDKRLKEGSPTDTGRLKVSWQISENVADGVGEPPNDYGNVLRPPDRTNYQGEKIGNTYIIYNNLEYAAAVIAGQNMPPSWKKGKRKGWRSRNNQIEKNYHLTVAKDIANFIRTNFKDT